MAIINGPYASKMRGKVGEVVAAKTTGNRTAVRSYQPNVKNPNTLRQRVSRTKLAMASAVAASLSEAIKIGFAKATAGTKMYARNMFVKSIVPMSADIFEVHGETVTMQYLKVETSKAVGITVKPVLMQAEATGGAAVKFTASNASEVVLPAGSTLGLVLVMTDPTLSMSRVFCGDPVQGIEVSMDKISVFGQPKVQAFFKEVPEAFNGVSSEAIPWKYPSMTGPCSALEDVQ